MRHGVRALAERWLVASWLAAAAVASSRAGSITLWPVADTTLSEAHPDNNFGAMPFFNSGTTQNGKLNRGLLKFDLASALPPGARISSATLTVEVVGDPDEKFPFARFNLHRLLRPWGEGSGTNSPGGGAGLGSPAAPGEATWTHRFAFTLDTWSRPGATAPDDFAPVITSGVTAGGVDQSPYTIPNTAQLAADLQLWLDALPTNHGWVLACEQESTKFTARRFGSREDANNAPQLVMDYLVAPRMEFAEVSGNDFRFSFVAESGQTYSVEYREAITSGIWQTLTNVGALAESTRITIADPLLATPRFFRLVTF